MKIMTRSKADQVSDPKARLNSVDFVGIKIGEQTFRLTERRGQLVIRTRDGSLIVRPIASNAVTLTEDFS